MSGLLVMAVALGLLLGMACLTTTDSPGPALTLPDDDQYDDDEVPSTALTDEEWARGRSPDTRGEA